MFLSRSTLDSCILLRSPPVYVNRTVSRNREMPTHRITWGRLYGIVQAMLDGTMNQQWRIRALLHFSEFESDEILLRLI